VRPLRVIQQPSQLLEQLMLPLPDGTHLGVQLLRVLCPLALAVHVEQSLQQRLRLPCREVGGQRVRLPTAEWPSAARRRARARHGACPDSGRRAADARPHRLSRPAGRARGTGAPAGAQRSTATRASVQSRSVCRRRSSAHRQTATTTARPAAHRRCRPRARSAAADREAAGAPAPPAPEDAGHAFTAAPSDL